MKIVFVFTELKELFDFSKTYSPGFYKDENDTYFVEMDGSVWTLSRNSNYKSIVFDDVKEEEKQTEKMISEGFALEMLRIVTDNKK